MDRDQEPEVTTVTRNVISPTSPPPDLEPDSKRRKVSGWLVAVIILVVLAIIIVIVIISYNKPPSQTSGTVARDLPSQSHFKLSGLELNSSGLDTRNFSVSSDNDCRGGEWSVYNNATKNCTTYTLPETGANPFQLKTGKGYRSINLSTPVFNQNMKVVDTEDAAECTSICSQDSECVAVQVTPTCIVYYGGKNPDAVTFIRN